MRNIRNKNKFKNELYLNNLIKKHHQFQKGTNGVFKYVS